MSKKKKLGYSQYEHLLAEAHQKIEFLAAKLQELQTYFIGYVEFHGENIEFNSWIEKRIEELQATKKSEEKEDLVNEEV